MTDDTRRQASALVEPLTAREQEILSLVAQQLTNRQIAAELHLAHSTIRWYLRQIYAKLGVKGRSEAMAQARALGLVAGDASSQTSGSDLPAAATPFVGRQAELQALGDLLLDPHSRLVTVVGPGGIGKTRLALVLAAQQKSRLLPGSDRLLFPHGVWYATLVAIESASQVVPVIAETLGLHLDPSDSLLRSPDRQLIDFLRRKRLLLVLDNFEHLLDAAPLLARLLKEALQIRVLVTSREPLQLQGEHRFWVHGLQLPDVISGRADAGEGALRLFANTARRMDQSFSMNQADVESAARICRLLQGLPLAIELAASWTGVLPLPAIEQEVRQGLEILSGELRDMPPRHRSMQATLEASWQRLGPAEKEIFQRLTVFRGGFTRNAAGHIAGAGIPVLKKLANTSWLDFDRNRRRYQIHELLRQFGESKLREEPEQERDARERHAQSFMAFLRQRERGWYGDEQAQLLREVQREIDNVRQAWAWAVAQKDVRLLADGLHSLCLYYDRRGYRAEAGALLEEASNALAAETDASMAGDLEAGRLQVRLLSWLGRFAASAEEGLATLERAATLLADLAQRGPDLRREEAFLAYQRGSQKLLASPLASRPYLQKAQALYGDLEDGVGQAQCTTALAVVAWHLGQYEQAADLARRGLEKQRALGNSRGTARGLEILGLVEKHRGRLEEAQQAHRESWALYRQSGNRFEAALMAGTLANTLIWCGLFGEARDVALRGLHEGEEMASNGVIAYTADSAANCLTHLGEYAEGQQHVDRALALTRARGDRQTEGWSSMFQGQLCLAAGSYEEAVAWLEQARALLAEYKKAVWMLPLALQALAQFRAGQPARARSALVEALQENRGTAVFHVVVNALPAAALLAAEEGDVARARELYALACCYPYVANSRWFEDVMAGDVAQWEKALSADDVAAARKRGRARDLWQTAQELLDAPHL